MKNDNKYKKVLPFIIIFALGLIVVYIPKLINNDKEKLNIKYDKNLIKDKYNVNEYIPVYVDDKQMSRKYLQDYIRNVLNDLDSSYSLLNEKYRADVFGDINLYRNYIESLNLAMSDDISKYSTYDRNGYKYYDMYDINGNRFIFRTNGVMQYEVLFDDYSLN